MIVGELFRKYNIWPFIIIAILSTILYSDYWTLYYMKFEPEPDWIFYINFGNKIIIVSLILIVYAIYLRVNKHPAFYNKSNAISMMIFVPMIALAFLFGLEIFVPKAILLGLYIGFLLILFYFYIKNYNNLYPTDVYATMNFFKNSLWVEIITILATYIVIVIVVLDHPLIGLSLMIGFGLIGYFFGARQKKKTYLDEVFKDPKASVALVIALNILLRLTLVQATIVYGIIVLIYFVFVRKRLLEKFEQ